jgi:hypothetical protein
MPDKHPKGSHNPSQKSLQRWDNEGGAPKGGLLKHPRDPAQLAKLMINIASGEVADPLRGSARIPRFDRGLVVQNHVQQGIMDFQFSVVFDKTQFAEFVHEKAHARSSRADDLEAYPVDSGQSICSRRGSWAGLRFCEDCLA